MRSGGLQTATHPFRPALPGTSATHAYIFYTPAAVFDVIHDDSPKNLPPKGSTTSAAPHAEKFCRCANFELAGRCRSHFDSGLRPTTPKCRSGSAAWTGLAGRTETGQSASDFHGHKLRCVRPNGRRDTLGKLQSWRPPSAVRLDRVFFRN